MAVTKIDISLLEDVGGANNLVKLDSNAKIPAGPATNLLNKPGPLTSTSDPAIDSNKALGTEWLNSTSGEMYICTDATTDLNTWTNVGAGSGNIEPWIYQGTQYGYTSGSGDPLTDAIEKHSYTADGNATDVANLTRARNSTNGHSSATHGYISAGGGAPHTYIEKFSFAAGTNAVSTGYYLSHGNAVRQDSATTSDKNYGYCAGGAALNVIDRFSYTTDGTATDVGDILATGFGLAGASSETYGYAAGYSAPYSNVIQKFAFGSSANATDVGDLTNTIVGATGHQSATHGYKMGGSQNGTYTTAASSIQKWTFASDANATNVGTTTVGRYEHASGSSTTHGYASGGSNAVGGNVIEKVSFTTDGNATDVGDLVTSRSYCSGQQY